MDHIPSYGSGGTGLGGGHGLSQCYVLSEHFSLPIHITGSLFPVSKDQIVEEWAFNRELICVMSEDIQLLTTQTFILLVLASSCEQAEQRGLMLEDYMVCFQAGTFLFTEVLLVIKIA